MRVPHILCAIGIALPPQADGGDERPLPLQVLEAEFEREFESGAAELEAKYREALIALARKFKAAGDLDGVLAIKAELGALESESAIEPAVMTLSAKAAITSGSVSFDAKHDLLASWKASGGARWDLSGLPPGTYSLTLHYYAGRFSGGKLRISAGRASKELEIRADDSWKELRFAPAGELEIDSEATWLKLSAIEARGLGLFELVRVELEPLAD